MIKTSDKTQNDIRFGKMKQKNLIRYQKDENGNENERNRLQKE